MTLPHIGDRGERARTLAADPTGADLARHIIDFDPDDPAHQLFAVQDRVSRQPLTPIPWPAGLAPSVVPLTPAPDPDAGLPHADVLVVTWTVAEAKALADVLTPGLPTSSWTAYRHNFDTVFKPQIRQGAPALTLGRLGLYAMTEIGGRRVLCLKSDLHLSQDGPKLPVRLLWKQIIEETAAELVITTGTAGAVGADVQLGDVALSKHVRFDCQKTFADQPFAQTRYTDRKHAGATSSQLRTAVDTLIPVNAAQLPPATRPPKIWTSTPDQPADVLTTDFFAFDDTTDHWALRATDPQARAVEMGDAVLGLVCAEDLTDPPAWVIVRNASDPQMDGSLPLKQQAAQAAGIYEKYGYWTTIVSAITVWALIAGL